MSIYVPQFRGREKLSLTCRGLQLNTGKTYDRGSFYSRIATLCGILLALSALYMFACLRVTSQVGSPTPAPSPAKTMKSVRRYTASGIPRTF
eukprot:187232-Pyramimonas_sp.AAC.4